MEALILTIDVAVMVYLCWRIYKSDQVGINAEDLGWLSYKETDRA